MRPTGLLRRTLLAAAAALALTALGAPGALAGEGHGGQDGGQDGAPGSGSTVEYVNMGDSYSAGSGVAPPAVGAPPGCLQSARNWGHVLAGTRGWDLTDVSCGGADTTDYTGSQMAGVPPQVEALSGSTDVVTMTIGGNDSGVFAETIRACGAAAARTAGTGNPCEQENGDRFTDTIEDVTYPSIVEALRTVQAAAPNATVAIAGYLQILPAEQGCYPVMPVASGDVPYLNRIQATLNDAVRRAAAATDVTFVDVTPASQGRDACRPIGTRWIEPVLGGTNPVVVHPNAAGERAMARLADAAL